MLTNAFSVDVEEHFQVSALSRVTQRSSWDAYESRVQQNTDRILQLMDESDTTGTFFTLGWVADKYPQMIRRIHEQGHEVACHGWGHELVYSQSPEVFREQTKRAKCTLENIIGTAILGYRAASFSIREDSQWALDILAEEGFRYDSSIYPIRHDLYGMPGAEVQPSYLTKHGIVEFPMTTASKGGMRFPVSGGGYFRLYPYWLTRWLLKSVQQQNRPIIFYIHPWEVDPQQPKFEVKGFAKFRHYNNLGKCEARMKRLFRDLQFTAVKQVLQNLSLL